GEPAAGAAEAVLASVRQAVASGVVPFPGSDGIPASVPAAPATAVSTHTELVAAPFRIAGTVDGGPTFDAVVPGPQAPDGVLRVRGTGGLRFTATPSLPDLAALDPAATGRDALRLADAAIWQAIRIGDVSAYLG